jgi:hypothetical protein
VSGTAKGESHAWNLVKMDGDYYYVDTTWGNSSYSGTDSTLESPFINYNYLGVTTDQISRTHTSNGNFCLPVCNAISDNYYIREGRFFTEWNPEEVGTLLTQAYQARTMMSVRFASSDIYNSAFDYFIGDGRIVDYCSGLTSLTYVEDKEQNVITFLFGA